jgi:NADPH2:quinone reductase
MTTEASPVTDAVEEAPATMMAWQVTALGEPVDVMSLQEIPVPEPGPGQVLVDVWSAGLNFPDALLARGQYQDRPPLPFTPGIELCGEIVAVGSGVERTRLGERVIGTPVLPHGSLAEFAIANADAVVPAPTALDDAHASVFHVAYQTGWFGLYRRANLRVGETLLVHAAAGGVGSAAVQLGRAQGAHVIGVVGSPEKVPVARKLGAEVVIDRSSEDVVAAVKEATKGRGADVIYDSVGGASFETSTKVVAFEGRLIVVGFASGEIPQAATNHVLVKNYSVLGLHWGLYHRYNPELIKRAGEELANLVGAGALYPLVSDRLAFEDAAQGITRLAAGETVGRLAVNMP